MKYRLAEPSIEQQDIAAVAEVLKSGWLIQGKKVAEFESALGGITDSAQHVVVSSGTSALHLAMLSLEIVPGDLVYVPSLAWPSAANIALLLGALPIFVDVTLPHGNINPNHLRSRIGDTVHKKWGRPRAIVPVHAFGSVCEIDAIMEIAAEFRLNVIEDAACSLGAKDKAGKSVGLFGDIGIFSFHPRKSLTTGEGGSVVSKRPELLERVRQLRDHGRQTPLTFAQAGLNYRMTEFQAALGIGQVARFDGMISKRRILANRYLSALAGINEITIPPDDALHTWQTFFVIADNQLTAQAIREGLSKEGIESGFPSHSAQSLTQFATLPGNAPMPVSERLRDCGIALPLHDRLNEHAVDEICAILRQITKSLTSSLHRERVISS
jgi:dTDP-4-amino-4,6-dideoxygalactose transaminase